MARVVAPSLLGLVVTLLAAGPGTAQSETFAEGVKLYRLGQLDEALVKFEEVLQEDPTNEEAFALFRAIDQDVWRALQIREDRIGNIARYLLDRATIGRRTASRDTDRIDELVADATSPKGDFQKRNTASLNLLADHGEFAVPALVRVLGNADEPEAQVHAILALQKLGRVATLPLVETLNSQNELIRRNAVAVMAQTRDERAIGALAHLASRDPSETVRYVAGRALAAMGKPETTDAGAAYRQFAADRLNASGVRSADRSDVVWNYSDDQGLVAADTPAVTYHLELAKKASLAALRLNPSDTAAKQLLVRSYLGEAAAINSALAANPEDEVLAGFDQKVPAMQMAAAAMGLPTLRGAVQASIQDNMVPTAVAGIELLGAMESREGLASSPLVAALDSDDSRVGYAAALALAKASGGGSLPNAAQVVKNLSEAVTEEAITLVKVIDNDALTQRNVDEATFSRGVRTDISDTALSGIDDLQTFPNVDVVVLGDTLSDALPEAVVGLIRKNPRLAHVKILVRTSNRDAAEAKFGDRVDGYIVGPATSEALKAAVNDVLADVETDSVKARADRVAVDASVALHELATRRIDVSPALANLTAQLDRGDNVAIPAAGAIGEGGSLAQVDALLQRLQSDEASLELRVACADAIGRVLGRSGQLGPEMFDQLLAVAVSADAPIALRTAAARALGQATLSPESSLRLAEALQVTAGGAADEMDG